MKPLFRLSSKVGVLFLLLLQAVSRLRAFTLHTNYHKQLQHQQQQQQRQMLRWTNGFNEYTRSPCASPFGNSKPSVINILAFLYCLLEDENTNAQRTSTLAEADDRDFPANPYYKWTNLERNHPLTDYQNLQFHQNGGGVLTSLLSETDDNNFEDSEAKIRKRHQPSLSVPNYFLAVKRRRKMSREQMREWLKGGRSRTSSRFRKPSRIVSQTGTFGRIRPQNKAPQTGTFSTIRPQKKPPLRNNNRPNTGMSSFGTLQKLRPSPTPQTETKAQRIERLRYWMLKSNSDASGRRRIPEMMRSQLGVKFKVVPSSRAGQPGTFGRFIKPSERRPGGRIRLSRPPVSRPIIC